MEQLNKEKTDKLRYSLLLALRKAKNMEKRLYEAFYYVEPNACLQDNCYSLLARDIIVQSCLEIESMFRNYLSLTSSALTRKEHFVPKFKEFLINFNILEELQKDITHFRPLTEYDALILMPWKECDNNKMPDWWSVGYNGTKHNNERELTQCTYRLAINALAGLYSLIGLIINQHKLKFFEETWKLKQHYLPEAFYNYNLCVLL